MLGQIALNPAILLPLLILVVIVIVILFSLNKIRSKETSKFQRTCETGSGIW